MTDIYNLMNKVESLNYEIYIVGGYVRDKLLNKENNDIDLVTNMPLSKIKEVYPSFRLMKDNDNREVGVIKLNNKIIEISKMKDKTIEKDLLKRDFTINTLLLDKDNNLIDKLNIIDDIYNKEIKVVKSDAFDIDPLRILRAIRLSIKLNFKIEDNTYILMINKANLLNNIKKERIYSEFKVILMSNNFEELFMKYKEIFFVIIPELEKCLNFNQHNIWHKYDILTHILKTVDNTEDNYYLKLAALFHDIGKPLVFTMDSNNIGHFYKHPVESNNIFLNWAKMYKIDKLTKTKVSTLIINHDRVFSNNINKIKKYILEFGIDNIILIFKLKKADNLSQNLDLTRNRILELDEQLELFKKVYSSNIFNIKDLDINGKDLLNLGYSNKEIGIILNKLLNEVLFNKLNNNKKDLLDYVQKSVN